MSDKPAAPAPAAEQPAAPAAPKKKLFSSRRLIIAGAVLGMMSVLAVVAMLLLPKGSSAPNGEAAEGAHPATAAGGEKAEGLSEVEIGQFSVSVEFEDGIVWNVSFKLFAGINPQQRAEAEACFTESHKARVRQAVVKVVRMSNIKDIRDPELDLLKRNLKAEINNTLPQRYVQQVIVSEIRTMQQ
jgi:flagellar basal body-associated protein FliL